MDDIQNKSLKAFEEMLKGIDKNELNNLIEEISSLDTLGEPVITEYFSQIEGQYAHFYFSEDIDNDCSKNNMGHFQSFQNIFNQKYDKVLVTKLTEINFNISLNNQHANNSFDLNSESKKSLKKNALAA